MRAGTPIYISKITPGATLVEVVITVGLLATMLLPLVSMLSLAIDNSGKAMNDTVSSRIASQLIGELQQADWKNVEEWADVEIFYDDQGVKIEGAEASSKSAYTARVRLDNAATGVVFSTAAAGAVPNFNGRKALVLVSSLAGTRGKTVLDEAESALTSSKELPRHVYVSRTLLVKLEKGY